MNCILKQSVLVALKFEWIDPGSWTSRKRKKYMTLLSDKASMTDQAENSCTPMDTFSVVGTWVMLISEYHVRRCCLIACMLVWSMMSKISVLYNLSKCKLYHFILYQLYVVKNIKRGILWYVFKYSYIFTPILFMEEPCDIIYSRIFSNYLPCAKFSACTDNKMIEKYTQSQPSQCMIMKKNKVFGIIPD